MVLVMSTLLFAAQPVSGDTVEEPASIAGQEVVITPGDGTRLDLEGTGHRTPLTVSGHAEGLAVTETVTVDQYLDGLAEVPFSWEPDALAAQTVAARTYLARTLADGRSTAGAAYGYDICVTTACQVYAGVDLVEGHDGERWRQAVRSTTDEILLDSAGRPAQTFYSSTSGGRTRSVEDIFTDSDPVPYLEAVESPGEDSPFAEWAFTLTADEMAVLADEAGLLRGSLEDVITETTDDGDGPWTVTIIGSEGSTTTPTWVLRTDLNSAAETTMPDRLPVSRPDVDRPFPQTILSPSFTIESIDVVLPDLFGPPIETQLYRVEGNGWGHLVGMSQYGAQAMATAGAGYAEILGHFYGGLQPTAAGSWLPDQLVVGLATERNEISVLPDGPVSVSVDGTVVADDALGTWRFEASGSELRVFPPVGLGLRPEIERLSVLGPLLVIKLTAAGELHVSAGSGSTWRVIRDWELVEAGTVRILLPPDPGLVTVMIASPDGFDRKQIQIRTREECLLRLGCFPGE